jgi:hypothetical protein
LSALKRPLWKQQIPHGLKAVRDDNSKSLSHRLLMRQWLAAYRLKQQYCSNRDQADVNILQKAVTVEATVYHPSQ